MWKYSLDDYVNVVRQRKLKLTNSRYAFLKALASLDDKHFTVNQIIAKIKADVGHVNVMSVYNIVELLLREHLLFATTLNGKSVSYELISPKLVHIRCDYCGLFFHLDDEQDDLDNNWWELFNELTEKYNVQLEHYKLEAHGICHNCKENGLDKVDSTFGS